MSTNRFSKTLLAIIVLALVGSAGYAAYRYYSRNSDNVSESNNTSDKSESSPRDNVDSDGKPKSSPPDIKPGTKVQVSDTPAPLKTPAEIEKTPQPTSQP